MHPNQEPAVIAGQGTIALEVLEQVRGPQCMTPDHTPHRQGHSREGYMSIHTSFLHRHPR